MPSRAQTHCAPSHFLNNTRESALKLLLRKHFFQFGARSLHPLLLFTASQISLNSRMQIECWQKSASKLFNIKLHNNSEAENN
jgi:hypothetical protein